jgi:hypothetical protein
LDAAIGNKYNFDWKLLQIPFATKKSSSKLFPFFGHPMHPQVFNGSGVKQILIKNPSVKSGINFGQKAHYENHYFYQIAFV